MYFAIAVGIAGVRVPGIIGESFRWRGNSHYTYCTGLEGVPGICWWCGQPHTLKTQCCCYNHKQEYLRHFDWKYAAGWALERASHTCQECGREEGYSKFRIRTGKSDIEVHHIIPLAGGKRMYTPLNCPCLLLVLCLECHGKKRRKRVVPIEELPLFTLDKGVTL